MNGDAYIIKKPADQSYNEVSMVSSIEHDPDPRPVKGLPKVIETLVWNESRDEFHWTEAMTGEGDPSLVRFRSYRMEFEAELKKLQPQPYWPRKKSEPNLCTML